MCMHAIKSLQLPHRKSQAAPLGLLASIWHHAAAGRELNSDSKLVQHVRLMDNYLLLAMATPVLLEYTQPSEDNDARQAASPAALVASQVAAHARPHVCTT